MALINGWAAALAAGLVAFSAWAADPAVTGKGLGAAREAAQDDAAALKEVRTKLGKLAMDQDGMLVMPEMGFADAYALIGFAAKAAEQATTAEAEGELELAAWRAVAVAVRALPVGPGEDYQRYDAFLKTFSKTVLYDELNYAYYISTDAMWNLADRYKDQAIGEEIAFFAAALHPGGNCEEDITCESLSALRHDAEYLRRYPRGRHVAEILVRINPVLAAVVEEWNTLVVQKEFDLAGWTALLKPLEDSPPARQARTLLARLTALKVP